MTETLFKDHVLCVTSSSSTTYRPSFAIHPLVFDLDMKISCFVLSA